MHARPGREKLLTIILRRIHTRAQGRDGKESEEPRTAAEISKCDRKHFYFLVFFTGISLSLSLSLCPTTVAARPDGPFTFGARNTRRSHAYSAVCADRCAPGCADRPKNPRFSSRCRSRAQTEPPKRMTL